MQHSDIDREGFAKSDCDDIGFSLLGFPVSGNILENEAGANVDPVLLGRQVQACPDAGGFTMTREAHKGERAGGIFQVCNDFSTCLCVAKA